MKEKLLDFIKNNSNNEFVIIYPESFGSWNIISFLVSIPQMIGNNLLIITDDNTKINESLSSPLPDQIFIEYSQVEDSMSTGLFDVADNILVLVDNLGKYYDYKLNDILGNTKCKVIVTTNGSDELVTNMVKMKLCIYDKGPVFNYQVKNITDKPKDDVIKNIVNFVLMNATSKHYIYTTDNKTIEYLSKLRTTYNVLSQILDFGSSSKNILQTQYYHLLDIKSLDYSFINDISLKRLYLGNIDVVNCIFFVDGNNNEELQNYNNLVDLIEYQKNNFNKLTIGCNSIGYDKINDVYVEFSKL